MIITVDEVKSRMALPEINDIDGAVTSAINVAQSYVEGVLQTSFAGVDDQLDVFFLDENKYPVIPDGMFRLRLKYGFVKEAAPVILYGETKDDMSLVVDPDLVAVDVMKGIAYVDAEHRNTYVSVLYDAGIAGEDVKAPVWLKEAILAYMPAAINATQPTNRSSETVQATQQATMLAAAIMEPYLRNVAFSFRPIFSA